MVLVALIVAGVGVWGIARLPTAFIPIEDQGYVLVTVQLPDGAALGRTQEVMEQVTKIALATPVWTRWSRSAASRCSTTAPRWRTPASPM